MPDYEDGKNQQKIEEEIATLAAAIRCFLRHRFSVNEHDLQDLVQETLTAAIEAVRRPGFTLDPGTKLTTFVLGIARHKALDFKKAGWMRKRSPMDRLNGKVDDSTDPESEAVTAEFVQNVKMLIDRLPEQQARVVDLYYAQGYSVAEIAKALELKAQEVSTLKFAALAKLRQWGSKEGFLLAIAAVFSWWTFWRLIHGL